jgi:hypothetical protein
MPRNYRRPDGATTAELVKAILAGADPAGLATALRDRIFAATHRLADLSHDSQLAKGTSGRMILPCSSGA